MTPLSPIQLRNIDGAVIARLVVQILVRVQRQSQRMVFVIRPSKTAVQAVPQMTERLLTRLQNIDGVVMGPMVAEILVRVQNLSQ